MDKKKITIIVVTGTIVLVVIVLGILYFSSMRRSTAAVELADTSVSESAEDTGLDGDVITLDASTVADVVSIMKRPENYRLQADVTVYGGVEKTVRGDMWVMPGKSRVTIAQPDGRIKTTVTAEGTAYIWYSDSGEKVFEAPALGFEADDAMMIYTYEALTGADRDSIVDALYVTECGESCIYAKLQEGETVTELWISAEKGILLKAQRSMGEKLVYSMTAVTLETDTVTEDVFTLPDGRTV